MNEQQSGSAYWRSFEELSDTLEFRELMDREFEGYDPEAIQTMPRRRFLKLMAASMALAGIGVGGVGCRRWPKETLAPYVERPDGRTPGTTVQYATIVERGGVATGVLATSFDGRPIKLDGNPQHPYSLGASDLTTQATVLSLYDPQRLRSVAMTSETGEKTSQNTTWQRFAELLDEKRSGWKGDGKSLAVLAEPSSSPSLAAMRAKLEEAFPGARWFNWSSISRDHETAAARVAFQKAARPVYHLDRAETIVCFDSDLLHAHPSALKHARDWAAGRRVIDGEKMTMNRLFVAEPGFTSTGSVADHRLAVRSSRIESLVRALASKLNVPGTYEPGALNGATDFIEKVATALSAESSRGHSLVVAGPDQPTEVHELVWTINATLGNIGPDKPITVVEDPIADEQPLTKQIDDLTKLMQRGQVKTLMILGGNPVYEAPADVLFADALASVETTIHLTERPNETTQVCQWRLPQAHSLEAWGDGRAWDGTPSVQQPLILPLFEDPQRQRGGRAAIEVLSMLAEDQPRRGYEIVRETWRQWLSETGFEKQWRKVLHDGLLMDAGTFAAIDRSPRDPATRPPLPLPPADQFEINFRPCMKLYDGRDAHNGWLQELPETFTRLTWDNAALLNVADAKKLGVGDGDMLRVQSGERSVDVPALRVPGQARGAITLWLGYGREHAGHVGSGVGFNVYPLRTSEHLGWISATAKPTGRRHTLAMTTMHHMIAQENATAKRIIEKRTGKKGKSGYVIKENTLEGYRTNPHFVHEKDHGDLSLQLFEGPEALNSGPHAWGMSVDMSACTGCGACVLACQSENNIPVVGKDQVLMSREMHWLRIDRYFKDDKKDEAKENPDVVYQPLMCVQCENAPCEQVCPVAATVHDTEGLNTMVYNRCIGTRYCSNNCPYKVRRFNYFDYHAKDVRGNAKPWLEMPDTQQTKEIGKIERMVFNPEVTVRMRGVMEKCTYCTQRLAEAKNNARIEFMQGERNEQRVLDGEVQTACQQSCATQAIWFGDLADPDSKVSKLHKQNRAYDLLAELNTRPRTKYLAKLRNPMDTEKAKVKEAHV